ncbi:Dolichyl-phosphate-mannose-protein mannosyltransferase [Eubacterium callanderi]|nr:Dolichyl-phosphate-mannose-protein mannosyltransferase [Eubacterium callanderi]
MTEKFYHLSKKEIIFLVAVILIYSVVGYWNLGSRVEPQTYYDMEEGTPAAEFELQKQPASIALYPTVNDSSKYVGIQILCSDDGVNWKQAFDTRDDDTDYTAAMIWYHYPLNTNESTRYIKVKKLDTANRLVLSEVAFFDENGNRLATTPLNEGSARLLDEPETVRTTSDRLNSAYFDESYFPASALEMQDGLSVAEMDHPPVGRLIIGLGMDLFGRTPFGFRFMQVLFGIAMLPLIYFFGKALFKSPLWSGIATLLLAFDFLHYTQTRIGTLDAFLVFFILAMYAFLYFFHISTSRPARYVFLLLSGIFTGLSIGTKWSGCYAALGLAVLYFYWLIRDMVKGDKGVRRQRLGESFFCCLAFIVIPVTIYTLSYIPYAGTIPDKGFFEVFFGHQQQMFGYHTGASTHYHHPYSSKWYTWLLALKPVFYYYQKAPETIYLYATGNPMVWGIGLFGTAFALVHGIWKRHSAGIVIGVGYFSQMIPWLFITRDTFLYHYFPMIPFLMLGVAYLFKYMGCTPQAKPWKKAYIGLFMAFTVFSFICAFPFIYGSPMKWDTVLFMRQLFMVFAGVMGGALLLLMGYDVYHLRRKKKESARLDENNGDML